MRPKPVGDGVNTLHDGDLIQVIGEVVDDLSGHVYRVSKLAVEIGRGLGLGEDDLERLALAGVLHDIGKIYVDPEILGKSEPLSESERDAMRRHPELGFDMTRHRLDPRVAEAILHHHEQFDGGGYPDGLAGQDIPLLSRIILVADAFDAITSPRAYQPALPDAFAIREIRRKSGSQFDPDVVAVFVELDASITLVIEPDDQRSVARG